MHVSGILHVNINCSNYERSLRFYEMLGFKTLWEVPETNSPEVAAAVGMPPYHVRGSLLILDKGINSTMIDLLEWKYPRDNEAPYPYLYHLGIARIALATKDLDADMAVLKAHGVELISDPACVEVQGFVSRFVCFKDPDGTVLELVEQTTK
jgi:catechol 2,3-dioxygenase-like lactoylglutathione lyase family enzyme